MSVVHNVHVCLSIAKLHGASVEPSKKTTPSNGGNTVPASVASSRKTNYPPQPNEKRDKRMWVTLSDAVSLITIKPFSFSLSFFFFLIRWEGLFQGQGCIYEVYKDPEKLKVDKSDPIMLVSRSYNTSYKNVV